MNFYCAITQIKGASSSRTNYLDRCAAVQAWIQRRLSWWWWPFERLTTTRTEHTTIPTYVIPLSSLGGFVMMGFGGESSHGRDGSLAGGASTKGGSKGRSIADAMMESVSTLVFLTGPMANEKEWKRVLGHRSAFSQAPTPQPAFSPLFFAHSSPFPSLPSPQQLLPFYSGHPSIHNRMNLKCSRFSNCGNSLLTRASEAFRRMK